MLYLPSVVWLSKRQSLSCRKKAKSMRPKTVEQGLKNMLGRRNLVLTFRESQNSSSRQAFQKSHTASFGMGLP